MLRSFTLKNFRCFQNFTLEPLERVNLIAGKNNVGKTSLLEAIFIFINPTNPELPFSVNRLRGISRGVRVEDIEEMMGFFFAQDIDKVIEISGVGDNNIQRSLKIRLAESQEAQLLQRSLYDDEIELVKANESLTTEIRPYNALVLEYQDETSKKISLHMSKTADGRFVGLRYQKEKFPLGIYLTTNIGSSSRRCCAL